jgi:hypothetical protein
VFTSIVPQARAFSTDREQLLWNPFALNQQTGLEEVPQIWPTNVIHYKLDDNFTDREKKLIRRAFSEFHAKTNVRWQPHTFQKDYVFIR